jgi:hypothetical protein
VIQLSVHHQTVSLQVAVRSRTTPHPSDNIASIDGVASYIRRGSFQGFPFGAPIRWRNSESLVYSAEIVVGEVQRTRGLEVVQLLRECIGQPRETTNGLTHGHILSFDEAGGYVPHVWATIAYFYYRQG